MFTYFDFTFSYEEIEQFLLAAPYQTDCFDYKANYFSSKANCFHHCMAKVVINRSGFISRVTFIPAGSEMENLRFDRNYSGEDYDRDKKFCSKMCTKNPFTINGQGAFT